MFRRFNVKMSLIVLLVSVAYAQASQQGSLNIAIVNPDHYRIVKFGVLHSNCSDLSTAKYYSTAYATVDDADYFDPSSWHGVGGQPDFIGAVLSEAGYAVEYFTQESFTAADISTYDLVIVQDPLDSNFKAFDKSVETTLPDLLEKTTSQSFNEKLRNYFNNGGKIILVGDAVKLLGSAPAPGKYTLDFSKTINVDEVANTQSQPSSCVPAKWLFIRGNPFCGHDRTGSGTHTVETSQLLSAGAKLSDITFFDGNDLPRSQTWSNTVYYPIDGISLLDVRVQGAGEYVLIGSTCSPPEYTVTVDDVLSHFMGYTEYNGKKIFYIGSDTYFDYDFIDYNGTWHAGQYLEMKHIITEQGKQAIVDLVNYAAPTIVDPPTAATGAATNISSTSATLSGTINPNGSNTSYYYVYGTTTSYGDTTLTRDAGFGTNNITVNEPISGLSPNTEYHFQLVASNSGGTTEGNDQFFTTNTVSVDDQHYMPLSYELKAAYPNPFNPGTSIGFALPKATRITLIVYDLWGREVSRLADGFFGAGNYSVKWRGIGENGQECPSGIYIVRMITPEFVGSEKIVKMK